MNSEKLNAPSTPIALDKETLELEESFEVKSEDQDQIESSTELQIPLGEFESPDAISNYLANLDTSEKLTILLGLLALYGDGDFSQKEIDKLRELIKSNDLELNNVVLRDPLDNELSIDEKLAWVLDAIKNIFSNMGEMSKDEIEGFFRSICGSLFVNLDTELMEKKKELFGPMLKEIAGADGSVSKGEKRLIKLFENYPVYPLTIVGRILGPLIYLYLVVMSIQVFAAVAIIASPYNAPVAMIIWVIFWGLKGKAIWSLLTKGKLFRR
jgi:hypothetical protein